jgi:hypothetical protein
MIKLLIAYLVLILAFIFGCIFLIRPDKVRAYYLKQWMPGLELFNLHKNSFWVRNFPGPWLFRLLGIGFIIMSSIILISLFRK